MGCYAPLQGFFITQGFKPGLQNCRHSLLSEPPGKPMNPGVGSQSLLQGLFLTKQSNWGLLQCRQILKQLNYQGSPKCWLLFLFSLPVMSDSLQLHGLQHTRPHCPSASHRVFPSSCSLCWWFSPAISSSDALFSFCSQSFPVSETFPMSQFFTSGGQSIGASASALVLPVNIQGWSPFRLTGLISLLAKGLSGVFESTTVQRYQFFGVLPPLYSASSSPALTTMCDHWEDHSLDYTDLCCHNNVSVFQYIVYISHLLLISWLQSPSAVILEPKKRKSVTTSTFSPTHHIVMGSDAMTLGFLFVCLFVF